VVLNQQECKGVSGGSVPGRPWSGSGPRHAAVSGPGSTTNDSQTIIIPLLSPGEAFLYFIRHQVKFEN